MRFIFGEMNQGLVGIVTSVFFAALFVWLLVRVSSSRRRELYEKLGHLPLDD